MVAHAVSQSAQRGARPFDPSHDLHAVAHLLEEAFRPEHTFPLSDSPLLRELGVWMWMLNYTPPFPESTLGFVWVEDGQIVGNVSVNPDEGRFDRYMISNVAVKPTYRRQGIARALMEATLDHLRSTSAKTAVLNVRPNNYGAVKLYRDLGFAEVETRGDWSLSPNAVSSLLKPSRAAAAQSDWHAMRLTDLAAAADLIRAAVPTGMQAYRAERGEFVLNVEDRFGEIVSDFFIAQTTHRWVLEQDGRMAALLLVRAQRFGTPHRMSAQVHPAFRGKVENALITQAFDDLSQFPRREIRALATGSHPEWIAALEQNGFTFLNGLTLMSLSL